MEKIGKTFCRLCLDSMCDGNFKEIEENVRDVLNALSLQLNIEEESKPRICNFCFDKLFAAFDFRATCIDTENSISPYVDSIKGMLIDLREIYAKERGGEHSSVMVNDERICRLCMRIAGCGFTPVKDVEVDMIHKYIPKVNFSLTQDPVICQVCLDSLDTHTSFLKNCLDVEEKIQNIRESKSAVDPFLVKTEEVEIKQEENDEASNVRFHRFKDEHVDCLADSPEDVKPAENNCALEPKRECHSPKDSDRLQTERHEFDSETKYEHSLTHGNDDRPSNHEVSCEKTHFPKVGTTSQIDTFECDTCGYKTSEKCNLKRHQITHMDPSEAPVYKCDSCNFETKHKVSLTRHQLIHKELSETQPYECGTCGFKTKHKSSLLNHKLKHTGLPDLKLYNCDVCDFKTKYKSSLRSHRLVHKEPSELQLYKCEACDYGTTRKSYLVRHQLRQHKDPAEVQFYKCDECNFKFKVKDNLVRHRSKHAHPSEPATLKCDVCDYATMYKSRLAVHRLRHVDHSEVQMYQCESCDFETKYKQSLGNHQLIHKNRAEAKSYKCGLCGFQTKYRGNFATHQLRRHKDPS